MPRPNLGYRLSDEPNKSGFYEIRWTEAGRSKRLSTGERALYEAQIALARFLLDGETDVGADAQREENGLTVREVCAHYEREVVADKELEESRVRIPRRLAMICAVWGDLYVKDMTQQHGRDYVRARGRGEIVPEGAAQRTKARMASPASCRNELALYNAAVNFGVADGKLPKSTPIMKLPKPAEAREAILTPEDAHRAILANAPKPGERMSRAYRLIVIGLSAPARQEAIRQLKWDRCDFVNRMIDFRVPGRPVTRKRRVKLAMSDSLYTLLFRAYQERISDYVLDSDKPIDKAFAVAMKRGGYVLPKGSGVHILRHSWATWQAQAGVSMTHIASVLGDTVQTTEKHYAKHSPHHLKDVVNGVTLPVAEALPLRVITGVTPGSGAKTGQHSPHLGNIVQVDPLLKMSIGG